MDGIENTKFGFQERCQNFPYKYCNAQVNALLEILKYYTTLTFIVRYSITFYWDFSAIVRKRRFSCVSARLSPFTDFLSIKVLNTITIK